MGILDRVEQRSGVSLEDPNVSLGGTTLIELLGGGRKAATGRRVNEDKALTFSAVWAAVAMISGHVGTLPLKLYRRLDNGGKTEERGHPTWGILHDRPNREMVSTTFREALQGHLLLRGNAYAEIETNGAGEVAGVWPLHPDRTHLKRTSSGQPFYEVETSGAPRRIHFENVWHIPGLGFDGRRGYSVIRMARESIALGLAPEEYAARFYGNNSRPAGILTSERGLSDTAMRRLKKSWEKVQGGLDNAHRVAVLEDGIQWQQIGMTAEDAEFMDTRKFQVREIARWFNIPPHKIRDLDNATFTNIEAQNIEFVVDTLTTWLVRWEQTANWKLLTPREREAGLFVEFSVDGLLRGDTEKRGQWYRERFNTGSITPNEIRGLENQNPIPGGDRAFVQVNMIPLDQAMSLSTQDRVDLLLAEQGVAPSRPQESAPEARARPREARSPAERVNLRQRFLPALTDAAFRVVSREIADVRTHADRLASGGDPSAFMSWLQEYYFGDQPEFFRTVMGPQFQTYAGVVAPVAAGEIDADEPEDLRAFVDEYLTRAANGYARSGRAQLEAIIRAIMDGESDAEPVEAVEQRLEEWDEGAGESAPRHERVARRHVVELNEAVAREAWVAAGVTAIVSVALGDSCPYCRGLDGTRIGTQEAFIAKGEEYEPDGADGPLTTEVDLRHPPYHRGCDCTTRASIL